jgi:mannose-6-phosphate isomerase-like protein (cupin superfamily)
VTGRGDADAVTGEAAREGTTPVKHEHAHGGRLVPLYQEWAEAQGIPIIDGHYVPSLGEVELAWWEMKGGAACFIHHEKSGSTNNGYVCEIGAGRALKEQQHMFEELVYVLGGSGKTIFWREDESQTSVAWQAGSLFAIPLNVRYQHVNTRADTPARYLGVTTMPTVVSLFDDLEFVFEDHYQFRSRAETLTRYDSEGRLNEMVWHRNYVPDLGTVPLRDYKERGGGGKNVKFSMAKSTLLPHVSEFGVGRYKKAHRHGPGAYVVILSGEGYSLMWPEGDRPRRYDWQKHSLVIPPERWFHQHFNTGADSARYLALKAPQSRFGVKNGLPLSSVSIREGGDQIDYEDEDPMVREMFEAALQSSRSSQAEVHEVAPDTSGRADR